MFTLKPGQTNQGLKCRHCVRTQKKYGTYCNIASHHRIRQPLQKTAIFSKDRILGIKKITDEYSYRNLITAVVLLFRDLYTIHQILEKATKVKTPQLASYLINITFTDTHKINEYLAYVHDIKNSFPKIQEARLVNKTYNRTQIWNPDLKIRDLNNREYYIVISDKTTLFKGKISNLCHYTEEISDIKKEMCAQAGYPNNFTAPTSSKYLEEIFAHTPGDNNKFWTALKNQITQDLTTITHKLVNAISSAHSKIPVYIINAGSIRVLNSGDFEGEKYRIVYDYTYYHKPQIRYFITKNNMRIYQMDIFFSSNFAAEPEFTISEYQEN